ncbi:SPOSA6832_03338, partial [Sporobolomyces salmonicolor]
MSLSSSLVGSCRTCLLVARPVAQRSLGCSAARPFASTSRIRSDSPTPPPTPSSSPLLEHSTRPIPYPSPKSTQSPQSKLLEARAQAQKQLKALLHTLDSSARKQAQAFSAALQALELERKLREVGGKINEATGYEEIERLRLGVGEKEKSLLKSRAKTLELKKEYTARVRLRADSQREVNDLLQRKSSWNSADVVRFTELVQQDHENEQAEARAKADMEAGEETVEKGFSELMQAILHRYHEEQVWSDKIRHLSTYGSLAITSLNVLLFIITLLLIEPWRRRRLVENVEERLRVNSREGQEATLAQLVSLQSLLADAQTKLDALTTSAVTSPPAEPLPETVSEPIPCLPVPVATSAEDEVEPQPQSRPAKTLGSIKSSEEALEYAKERIEGNEVWAAGAAGVLGGIALASICSVLGR